MTSARKTPHGPTEAGTPRRAPSKTPAGKSARRSTGASASSADESSPHAAGAANGGRASVRVYRQGLGDCILVRVKRANRDDFKLLIDCGVVLGTPNAGDIMTGVVENLVKDTDQKVDAIAITHEHWDHVSGFTQAKDSFKKLKTDEVWVAWTEDKDDELANTLRSELGKAAQALAASATALRAVGDSETVQMLADIALTPFGAAGASTSAALDSVKSMGKVRICRPSGKPIEIEGANARFYVLGPPHDPTLIRKINPSTKNPETYGLVMNGEGALPFGVVAALASREEAADDKAAPFHPRVRIPLGPKGGPAVGDSHAFDKDVKKAWEAVDSFFREHYAGHDGADDWRRIDGEWLGSATELALALQSYTNNTSLVLALELGDPGKGDVLLFAADAQVGNWESWQSWECQLDGGKLTGPDLLKRTIFYKVGHHGSHNATLKEHGVEEMAALRTAIIPVDEEEAKKKRWGRMPLPDLIAALEKKAPGMVLRTDQKPANPPNDVVIGDNYFEVRL